MLVCLAFDRLTSEKKQKKTGYVVFVHFRTFGREIFIRVIEFGWCGSIPPPSTSSWLHPLPRTIRLHCLCFAPTTTRTRTSPSSRTTCTPGRTACTACTILPALSARSHPTPTGMSSPRMSSPQCPQFPLQAPIPDRPSSLRGCVRGPTPSCQLEVTQTARASPPTRTSWTPSTPAGCRPPST